MAEKNVIFTLETKVKDGDGPKELGQELLKTDENARKAQATLDEFTRKLERNAQAQKTTAGETAKASAAIKSEGTDIAATTAKVATMGETIAKAGKGIQTFVGIDAETKAFLTPLISQTEQLGEDAIETAGDLDFLKQKAQDLSGTKFGPAPTSSPVGQQLPQGSAPIDVNPIPEFTEDTKLLAATLLALGDQGQEAFDRLGVSIQEDTALMKELVDIASQTPEGAAALAQDLDEAQISALNTLEAMGSITAEQRPIVEQAIKLKNAQGEVDTATKKTVGSYTSLRSQLRQAKAELDQLVEASDGKITPEIVAAAKKAGELEDRFSDLNDTVAAFNPDKKFQAITGVVQNLAGGFTAVQGALAIVGVESEGTAKALLKVQGALAITQGLQSLFGGLSDNLKNIRLLFASSAVSARGLAIAEGQAAAGAVTQGVATTGLRGALAGARAMAISLWTTLVANPFIAVAAGIALLAVAIVNFTRNTEEAQETVDEFYDRLESRRKQAEQNRQFRSAFAQIQDEIDLLGTQQTAEDKLANARKENARAEADAQSALQEQQRVTNDLEAERNRILEERRRKEIAQARAGAGFSRQDDPTGEASAIAKRVEGEKKAAELKSTLLETLSEEEKTRIEEIDKKLKESIDAEGKSRQDLALIVKRGELEERKGIEAVSKEREAAAKKAREDAEKLVKAGTIADLQKQQAALSKTLNEQLVIGSPEFFTTAAKYIEVTKALTNAQDSIKGVEVFAGGSLNDLNQELAFLKQALQGLPEDAENFDAIAEAANDLQKQIDALNERLKPKDNKEETARRLASLQEAERTALAFSALDERAATTRAEQANASEAELLRIQLQFQQERLKLQLDFELQRLEIMRKSGTATEQELTNQTNKIKELRAELALPPDNIEDRSLKELVDNIITAADQIAQAGIRAWAAWSDAQGQALDAQIANQRRAVDDATELADKGNARVLEEEKKRLQELLDARKKAAQQSAAIAQVEAAANAVVAISRAAAEGGGFLSAVTIASTLIALTAGIAQARSLASSSVPSFYGGGSAKWSTLGGYTGKGDPRTPSTQVGTKPYQYEREEYIMPHDVVGIGRNRQWFEHIHRGRKNVDDLMGPKMSVRVEKGGDAISDRQVDRIVGAVERIPKTSVRFDGNGLTMMLRGRLRAQSILKARL